MEQYKKTKIYIATFGFVLFIIFLIGIFWFITTPEQTVGLTLAFVAGLSMIFLPCTLPLAFVIVPLTMGQNPKKGFLMALFFGLGLAITLSIYGIVIAGLGKIIGLNKATQVMFFIAGLAAFLFGLSEVGLLRFKMPSYSGNVPGFIQQKGDYLKTFFLGLFLGNAGIGCPNPAFYVLLAYIAGVGSIGYGWFLGFIHGIGRAVPLIFLAILGILGINATGGLVKRKATVEKVMGWALIIIGAFILTLGIFGHDWYIQSGIHTSWERLAVTVGGERFGEIVLRHAHEEIHGEWLKYGNWFMGLLIVMPIAWHFLKRRRKKESPDINMNNNQANSNN